MNRLIFIARCCAFGFLMLAGCGGGGDEGNTAGYLAGSWFGVVEDDTGGLHTLDLQVDGAGNVVEATIDDVATGTTGQINDDWDENLFHVLFNGGGTFVRAFMIVDDSYSYAVFADRNGYVGGLQRGAVALPTYQSDDIIGSYDGGAYEYGPTPRGWNWEGEAFGLTVDSNLDFTGTSASGAISGQFDTALISTTYGGYTGTLDTPSVNDMEIKAFMSPDKNFVAAYAWDSTTTPTSIDDYILIGLVR